MATYQDGNVRRATANTVTAMRRSAERRRCPKCQRKSAIIDLSDEYVRIKACRWEGCGYYVESPRPLPTDPCDSDETARVDDA